MTAYYCIDMKMYSAIILNGIDDIFNKGEDTMRFLILRETGFTTFMSCIGVISGAFALICWPEVFDKDYMLLGPAIVSTVICIVFYGIAFISCRKAVKKRAQAEAQYRADHPEFFNK